MSVQAAVKFTLSDSLQSEFSLNNICDKNLTSLIAVTERGLCNSFLVCVKDS